MEYPSAHRDWGFSGVEILGIRDRKDVGWRERHDGLKSVLERCGFWSSTFGDLSHPSIPFLEAWDFHHLCLIDKLYPKR